MLRLARSVVLPLALVGAVALIGSLDPAAGLIVGGLAMAALGRLP